MHVPRAQGCCGALHAHAGRLDDGVCARASSSQRALDGYDYIVTNAAGCGSHLKDHGVAERRRRLGAARRRRAPSGTRCRCASRSRTPATCATRRASSTEPRAMLDAIPGLERLEPAEQDICCGSAGIYNIVQPATAAELGDRKAGHVLATEPDAYASGNPGCLVQVTAALRRAGRPTPAFHPIELVDASIRGLSPDAAAPGGPPMTRRRRSHSRCRRVPAPAAARARRRPRGDPRGARGACAAAARRRAARLPRGDAQRARGRLARAAGAGGSGRPPRRDHGADRPQDGDQRAELRREGLHDRLRGCELADVGEHDRRPAQPLRRDRPHDPARAGREGLRAERRGGDARSCGRAAGTWSSGTSRSTARRCRRRCSTSGCTSSATTSG